MKSDKIWNVFIRLTHERKVCYISTTMYVIRKELVSTFKIKNAQVLEKVDALMRASQTSGFH